MTREDLDRIFEILRNMDSVDKILEICTICNDEHLVNIMQNAIQAGSEQLELAFEQLFETINAKMPSELLDYYYIKAIDMGFEYIINDNQIEQAQERYENIIQEIIQSNEDERIKKAEEIYTFTSKLRILESLSDAKKIEILDNLDNQMKNQVALTITDDSMLLQAVDKVSDRFSKISIVEKMNPEMRLLALDKLESEDRYRVVKSIDNPEIQLKALNKLSKSDKILFAANTDNTHVKLKVLEQLEPQDKLEIIKSISAPKQRLELLGQLQGSDKLEVAMSLQDPLLMLQARDMLEDRYKGKLMDTIEKTIEQQPPEESILRRLYNNNPVVLKRINYKLLDPKYIDTLGEEKISVISIRTGVQNLILGLDDKRYNLFCKCIDSYLLSAKTEDWRPIAQILLQRMETGEYDQLIDNIQDINKVDFSKLNKIIQLENIYGIQTLEDINNYEQIVREYCDKIISSDSNLEEKKNAVLQKIFGQNLKYAKDMLSSFGEDIQNIDDCDEKDFILSLKAIVNIENEDILKEIYSKCDEVELVDGIAIESKIRTAYAKKFRDGLYEPKEEDLISEQDLDEEFKDTDLKVYDAGTKLKMILTSTSLYDYKNIISNYASDWNRPVNNVQHCCTSYIRNDMLGIAGIRHFCYGFTDMKPDALRNSNYVDAYTPMTDTAYEESMILDNAKGFSCFCTPDTQINKTQDFNEMDYYFMQGGKKIQPDYIIAFRRGGKIDNIDKILQGAKDWKGKLPIVIVDVDRCLAAERQKIDDMLTQYSSKKTPQLAREILQKIRNNRQTDEAFCNDIQTQIFEIKNWLKENEVNNVKDEQVEPNKVGIKEMAENSQKILPQERQEVVSAMKNIKVKLQEMTNMREGEDFGQR